MSTQHANDRPRVAAAADVRTVAELLDAFNREYEQPTPGVEVLTARLERVLAGVDAVAVLVGEPANGLAFLTLRPSIWFEGPVAVLDELYVVPTMRGHGLGSVLLAAAEDVIRARGGELLEINVDGYDTDARRFYERHGYRNHEEDTDEPLLYYFRELTGPAPTSGDLTTSH